ncbi:hypothetical protein AAF712_014309 [Marasmius tenuissimus]|uniref:Uncharacterized protein n=1 Tax=Marasmius tenuissimus TaxID=585030 RepID=A0ABR2ZCM2_9AGAR
MFATKLFAAFTFVSFGLVASNPVAAPDAVPVVDLMKRADNADVMQVFQTLKASTDTILSQIDKLTYSGTADDFNFPPLINKLLANIDRAARALSMLKVSETRKRQTDDEIANLVAGIVKSIATTMQPLAQLATSDRIGVSISNSVLRRLLNDIDDSLAQALQRLNGVLVGVLGRVANLLTDLATILRNLGLGLTIGALGL